MFAFVTRQRSLEEQEGERELEAKHFALSSPLPNRRANIRRTAAFIVLF